MSFGLSQFPVSAEKIDGVEYLWDKRFSGSENVSRLLDLGGRLLETPPLKDPTA